MNKERIKKCGWGVIIGLLVPLVAGIVSQSMKHNVTIAVIELQIQNIQEEIFEIKEYYYSIQQEITKFRLEFNTLHHQAHVNFPLEDTRTTQPER